MEVAKYEVNSKSILYKLENSDESESLSSNVNTENSLPEFSQNICSLDYSSFPHVLFRGLPWETQRLIKNGIKHAKCPLFVLVTHKNGHWCIVQLNTYSDVDELITCTDIIPSNSPKHLSKSISSLPDKRVSSLEINLNPTTRAIFSEASVNFITTNDCIAENWHCPFCSTCFSQHEIIHNSVLKQHLRLHVELRCCIDCSTILPNDWSLADPVAGRLHVCSDLFRKADREHIGSDQFSSSDSGSAVCLNQAIRILDRSDVSIANSTPSTSPESDVYYNRFVNSSTVNHQTSIASPDNHIATNPKKITTCFRCGIDFKKHVQYQQHMKNVHHGRQFLCPDCDASFSTKGNLTKHFAQVHNQNTRLVCHLCQKRLSNKFNLDRHFRFVHSNCMQPISSTCGTFSSHETLACQNDLSNSSTALTDLPISDSHSQPIVTQTGTPSSLHRSTNSTLSHTLPRGYYLYLSNKECEIKNVTQNQCFIREEKGTHHATPVSLVAEVELTSCLPSSPDAQYGTGGTIWRPNVHIVETKVSSTLENS